MKKSSTVLVVREMQIEATVRYQLTLVRVAIILKDKKELVLVKIGKKELLGTSGENVVIQSF